MQSERRLLSRLQSGHFNKLNEYKLLVVMVLSLNQSATPGPSQCTPISLQAPCYRILHHCKLLPWRSAKSRRGDAIFLLHGDFCAEAKQLLYPERGGGRETEKESNSAEMCIHSQFTLELLKVEIFNRYPSFPPRE